MQCVATHELCELEEVGDPAGFLQRLVQVLVAAWNIDVPPELVTQNGNELERLPQPGVVPRHAAVVPHDPAELPMKRVDGALPVDCEEPLRSLRHLGFRFSKGGMRRIDFLWTRAREIISNCIRNHEVAVSESLHERACAEPVRSMIGKVCLSYHV